MTTYHPSLCSSVVDYLTSVFNVVFNSHLGLNFFLCTDKLILSGHPLLSRQPLGKCRSISPSLHVGDMLLANAIPMFLVKNACIKQTLEPFPMLSAYDFITGLTVVSCL